MTGNAIGLCFLEYNTALIEKKSKYGSEVAGDSIKGQPLSNASIALFLLTPTISQSRIAADSRPRRHPHHENRRSWLGTGETV
ncbi:hypothetical protein DFH06DRAFT_1470831 [Mycena polygramma]|nr:hypothetical protein DFH06DRAFT_1470831 [Mycena polygramma]